MQRVQAEKAGWREQEGIGGKSPEVRLSGGTRSPVQGLSRADARSYVRWATVLE